MRIPTQLDATVNQVVIKSEPVTMLLKRNTNVLPLDHDGTTRICRLSVNICPTAIIRMVIAIIILSVQCETMGTLSHIGEEVLKVVPSRANLDAATAIVAITFSPRRVATAHHCAPDMVQIRVLGCKSILGKAHAAARRAVSVFKSMVAYRQCVPAVTLAHSTFSGRPIPVTDRLSGTDSNEHPEPSADFYWSVFRHSRSLSNMLVAANGSFWREAA